MSLITLVLTLIAVGVLLWAINQFIPMDGKIKAILNIVVVVVLLLWLLNVFGILSSISGIRVGR
jgi:cation transporter-like permease